ncbi:hypothetical protein C0J52_11042, partial [Blattella germanica]
TQENERRDPTQGHTNGVAVYHPSRSHALSYTTIRKKTLNSCLVWMDTTALKLTDKCMLPSEGRFGSSAMTMYFVGIPRNCMFITSKLASIKA